MLDLERRLAGMNCHYIHYTLDYFLDRMAELGIKHIELWGAAPHFYVEDADAGDAAKVGRLIGERNLDLICFTPEQVTYPLNLAAREKRLRRRSVDYYLKAAGLCRELGTGRMLVTPGWGYLDEPAGEAFKRSLESLEELVRAAEREDITLLLEHLSPISSNLVNRAEDLRKVLEVLPSSRLKAMADTAQVFLAGERIETYFEVLGEELQHIHFVDGTPGGHLALGDGELPLREELFSLLGRGYTGFLTMEIADRRYFTEPERADRRSLEWFRRATGGAVRGEGEI